MQGYRIIKTLHIELGGGGWRQRVVIFFTFYELGTNGRHVENNKGTTTTVL
jgi:hypothetical protein